MSETRSYPNETRLNLFYQPLELIDEKALADACTHKWYNQTLCQVNESVVRLGVVQGEYHWHKHDDDDEFFYVIEGTFFSDLEGRTIELAPRQGFVVPKGVMHCTRAPERAVILMVEKAGIIPTGNSLARRQNLERLPGSTFPRELPSLARARFREPGS